MSTLDNPGCRWLPWLCLTMAAWLGIALAGCSGTDGTSGPSDEPVGQNISQELPTGQAQAGGRLALQFDCEGCHRDLPLAPAWQDPELAPIGVRAVGRIAAADYSGRAESAEQYLLESIVDPSAYVVAGYEDGLMPVRYAEQLTRQQAADLIAYLLSFGP